MNTETNYRVRVIKEYQAPYSDPIQAKAGDEVTVDPGKETDIPGWVWCTSRDGKGGWVPFVYVEINGEHGRMRQDYNAIELTIRVGEILTVHKTESSFHWVTNENGQQGWVPTTHVESTEESENK